MLRYRFLFTALTAVMIALSVPGVAGALPGDEGPPPLPVIEPMPTGWTPKFPFPYDETQRNVTEADINAEREMCQWFNAQYDELMHQIDVFDVHLIRNNGDYRVDGVQPHADAVVANVDQSLGYLAPRAAALTQSRDFAGDVYFPLYQGESFYRLWQHLSDVSAGIKGHQAAWFYGPSVQRVLHWGSRINRSHVCR